MSDLETPSDWTEKKIEDMAKLQKGITYSTTDYTDADRGHPFITLKCISKNGGYSARGLKFFSGNHSEGHILHKGDIVFANTDLTRNGDVVGSPLIYRDLGFIKPTLFSMDLSKVVIDESETNSKFMYYWLMQSGCKRYMINASAGSTVLHLDTKQAVRFSSAVPPLPEQQKIASILTSVDEVIEKTQSQINKLQDLKKGTMNELLTRGIGHTEFKDSPVGRIPKGWGVVTIDESEIQVLDGDRGNEYPKERDFTPTGYCLFLSAKNVTKHGFKFDEQMFVSKEKDEKLRKGRLVRGDIVITTRGTVGNMAYFDDTVSHEIIRINSGMAILRNDERSYSSRYFFQLMRSPSVKTQIDLLTFGSAQPQLTIGVINSLKLPTPPLPEQNKIASILSSIDTNIEEKKKKLQHTQSLKKSLMQDLLTGKVRVSVN